MKRFLLSALFIGLYYSGTAQNVFPSAGNVGIGTPDPAYSLHVKNDGSSTTAVENRSPLPNAFSRFLILNDRGEGSYGDLIQYSSRSTGQLFNSIMANKVMLYSAGEFSEGLTIGTINDKPLAFGTMNQERMRIDGIGRIGVGTANPSAKLQIINEPQDSNGNTFIIGHTDAPNLRLGFNTTYSWIQSHGSKPLHINEFGNHVIINKDAGNVGIGTADPGVYRLAVNGKIRAQEIKIEAASWPDYVFEKGYKVRSLESLEEFIKDNGHLPEVPSAAEVKAEGFELGEMNRNLLLKIEELTLYLIEQSKKMDRLEKILNSQQNEIIQLKKFL